ncbi:DcrB-related protein [Serratia microhaemolytica]|uniref:DcrB-related protein n=1 Tax=Serratia microhaemolytica TaxID=2675110 RepID=UPI000FDDC57A|nr:DcrB-related protein [Serratia microhaemolytica]
MQYHMLEGVFTLAEEKEQIQDESLNILKFPARQSALVITRAVLPDGQSLDAYYQQQIAKLSDNLHHFQIDEKQPVTLAATAQPARQSYQTRCQFEQKGQPMHQCLLFSEMGGKLLSLTYSQTRAFSKSDLAHWQAIIDSLQLD